MPTQKLSLYLLYRHHMPFLERLSSARLQRTRPLRKTEMGASGYNNGPTYIDIIDIRGNESIW